MDTTLPGQDDGGGGGALPLDTVSDSHGDGSSCAAAEEEEKMVKKSFRYCGLYHNCQLVGGKKRKCSESAGEIVPAKRAKPSDGGRLFPPPFARGEVWMLKESDFRLPHDIWWLQEHKKLRPKPIVASKFKKIRTNDYSSLNGAVSAASRDIPVCSCTPPADAAEPCCGEDCLNRMVFTECMSGRCACGNQCSNQRFQKRQWCPDIQRFLTNRCGFGLRTTGLIKKGLFIIEYVGEVITESEFRRRQVTNYHEQSNHYCLSLHGGLVIDSTGCGNEARFVNHSCEPNCEMQCWSVCGQYRMGLFALRDLEAGTELLYDYRFDSLDNEAQACRCGSDQCRGFLCRPRLAEELQTLRDSLQTKRRRRKNKSAMWDTAKPVELFSKADTLKILSKREEAFCVRHRLFLVRNAMRSPLWRILIENLLAKKTPSCQASSVARQPTPTSAQHGCKGKNAFRSALVSLMSGRLEGSRHVQINPEDLDFLRRLHLAQLCHGIVDFISRSKANDCRRHVDTLRLPPRHKQPSYYAELDTVLDFDTISQRLSDGHYTDGNQFERDVGQLVFNAKKFFSPDSSEYVSACAVDSLYRSIRPQLIPHMAGTSALKGLAFGMPPLPNGTQPLTVAKGNSIIATTGAMATQQTPAQLPASRPVGDRGSMLTVEITNLHGKPVFCPASTELAAASVMCRQFRPLTAETAELAKEQPDCPVAWQPIGVSGLLTPPLLSMPEVPLVETDCVSCASPTSDEAEDQGINCACGIQSEDGAMICCDQCQSWQHCHCVGRSADAEEAYLCRVCRPRQAPADIGLEVQPALCLPNFTYYRHVTDTTGFSVCLGSTVYISRRPLPDSSSRQRFFARGQSPATDVFHVCNIWRDAEADGRAYVFGYYYFRPGETYPTPSRRFHGNELVLSSHATTVPLQDVVKHCVVMTTELCSSGTALGYDKKDVYICDFVCDRKKTHFSSVSKSKTRRYHFEPTRWTFQQHKSPVEIKRNFRLDKSGSLVVASDESLTPSARRSAAPSSGKRVAFSKPVAVKKEEPSTAEGEIAADPSTGPDIPITAAADAVADAGTSHITMATGKEAGNEATVSTTTGMKEADPAEESSRLPAAALFKTKQERLTSVAEKLAQRGNITLNDVAETDWLRACGLRATVATVAEAEAGSSADPAEGQPLVAGKRRRKRNRMFDDGFIC